MAHTFTSFSRRLMMQSGRAATWVGRVLLIGFAIFEPNSAFSDPATRPAIRFENPLLRAESASHQMGGVNSIVQDHLGFIWMGSENGLGRFDGRTLKLYQADSRDPAALPASFIRQMAVDQEGVLWITTEAGLVRYNVETDDFSRIVEVGGVRFHAESVSAITVGADNTLYVGTARGLHVIDPKRDRMHVHHPRSPMAVDPNSRQIRDIEIDASQRIWLATAGDGVAIFEPQTETFEYLLHASDNPNSLLYNSVASILHDDQGRAWLGTYGGGISRLDPDTGIFTQFIHERDNPRSLNSNIVTNLIQDSEGIIWVTLDHGGLARFDEPSQSFFRYLDSASDPSSPISNQLRVVFEDNRGDLWLGAFPSGVGFYNRSTQIFRHYTNRVQDDTSLSNNAILKFKEATDGTIWVGTEGGLNALNPDTGLFRRYVADPTNPHALNANPVLAIEEDVDGQLWLGTWGGGLHRFDPSSERFQRYLPSASAPQSINSKFIWDIILDRKERLWIATETGGLNHYQRKTDSFTHFVHDPDDATSISGNYLLNLQEDQYGKIWIGTFTGLDRFDPEQGIFKHFPHKNGVPTATSSKNIKCVYEDSRGRIWAGTHHQGVNVFDPSTQTFTHLDTHDGLPSSNIASIIEDKSGAIWLSTTNGLAKLTGPDWQVTVYGRNEGVAGSNFNRDASLRTRAGLMYFGSSEGITAFDPAKLDLPTGEFPVRITQLRILNQEARIGGEGSPLSKSITLTESLVFSHKDNMFSFDFAALDFRNAAALRYSYMLEGFDQGWHDIGQSNSATYTNLNPGHYVFRVRAAAHGEWQEGQALAITIAPPPWRTWWAYGLYGLLFLLMLYFRHAYVQLHKRAAIYQSKSITDSLTGLYNRYGIAQVAEGIFANAQTKQGVCVMLLDIDHFKRINDRRGHDAGDRILQEVTAVAQRCIRQNDHFGRWGGEEFIMLCTTQTPAKSVLLAEKIRAAIESHAYERETSEVHVTMSIGVADIRPDDTFETALKRADLALYQAKELGRNCVVVSG